jgi:hypothetical protein
MSAINTAHFAVNKHQLMMNDYMRMMAAALARNFYLQNKDIQDDIGPSELEECLSEITRFIEKDSASHSDLIIEALATMANCNITVIYEDREKPYTFRPNTHMQKQLHGTKWDKQQPINTIYIVNRARHETTGDSAPEHYNAAVQMHIGMDEELQGKKTEGKGMAERNRDLDFTSMDLSPTISTVLNSISNHIRCIIAAIVRIILTNPVHDMSIYYYQ